MKEICFLFLLFCVKTIVAQENQSVSYANTSHRQHGVVTLYTDATNMTGFINNVNPRAARNLLKTFNDANNIQWKIDDREITAYFAKSNVDTKVRYNKDGNRISIRKVYGENKLDRYISFIAKKGLEKDFSIFLVTELNIGDDKFYEITFQNNLYWCVVRILETKDGLLERLGENEMFAKV